MSDDVLIVGAGPAGAVAAATLAAAGASVRLVDRARFPRDKLCGDTVNPGTLALLDRLGVGAAVRRVSRPITGMIVSGPGGARVIADYPGGLVGAALRRSTLDQLLLDRAIQAGARFDEGVPVHAPLHDGGGRVRGVRVRGRTQPWCELRARMVIAADGRGSRLASALGLSCWSTPRRWAFGTYVSGVAGTTSRGEMHVRPDGYIGVAALPDDMANVCVVRDFTQPARAGGVNARQLIERVIREDPALAGRFDRAAVGPVSVLGPLGVNISGAGVAGLLLAGDAAGFVDPLTGDGLRFAVRGGEMAAQAALQELACGVSAHQLLAAARRQEFAAKARFNRMLRRLTASPAGVAAVARLASWWARPLEPLIRIAGDCSLARQVSR